MRISDWSSDVCSSDLLRHETAGAAVSLQVETTVWALLCARRRAGPQRGADTQQDQQQREDEPDTGAAGKRPARSRGLLRPVPHLTPGRTCRRGPGASTYRSRGRSEEHTSELQSLMRISDAVFCLKTKKHTLKT